MRYADASAYDILWADALIVEERAVGGHAVKRATGSVSRAKRGQRASQATKSKKSASKKKAAKKTAKRTKAVKQRAASKKGGSDA
jgi:hypothetical protein